MSASGKSWTVAQFEQMKMLWTEGKSASQIALILGGGISRNAVLSKAHRAHLPPRSDDAKRQAMRGVRSAPRLQQPRAAPRLFAAPLNAPDPIGPVYDVPPFGCCRWPHGDTGTKDWRMCGHPVLGASSWCEFHADRATDSAETRRVARLQRGVR